MTVNKYLMPFLVILALFASVTIAKAAGAWSVSGKQLLDVQALSSGDDVRGWMTFQQLSDGYGIPKDTLYELLGIPPEIAVETALKDMESILADFEVSTVREKIDTYLEQAQPLGDMQDSGSSSITPAPAASADQTGLISESEVNDIYPEQTASPPEGSGVGPTALPAGQVLSGSEIKGRHTLQDIVDQCNVPASDLITALGLPLDVDMITPVKDLAAQGQVVDVQNVRDIVTAMQNR
jgi:hypothetical protein